MNFPKALLLASFTLTLGTSGFASFKPPIQTQNQFAESLKKLNALDEAQTEKLFDLKNNKGESIFRRKSKEQPGQWATLDPENDQIEGTSTEKVYRNFRIKKRRNAVIVAVIDSGVDIHHEDLRKNIWVNEEELYGVPGVDDDHDGYVDDIYGWNFLGNKKGENVDGTNLEVTRLYAKLKKKLESGTQLTSEETTQLKAYEQEVNEGLAYAAQGLELYESFDAAIKLLKENGLKEETLLGLDAVTSTDPEILNAKKLVTRLYKKNKTSADVKRGIESFQTQLKYYYNTDFDSSQIIGDNPEILNEKGYGNNDVTGPDSTHGTHVAGIIAGIRDNHIGIKGQGRNIKIMSLRAVPNGDERDKDVGNAIRYAVDHGARVINMSFGKPYSPNKSYVDEAVKYAEAKGVLLVHAAGNDSKNTESQDNNFPNRKVNASTRAERQVENWIEVGASSKTKGINLPADFSNYGKTSVDVFAPGKDIVSTLPGNAYGSLSGTSMASPEVAGVAALLLEKFPNATALEVKEAILSTVNHYDGLSCALPGTASDESPTLISFSSLSTMGGTVNAYEAMLKMFEL